MGRKRARPSSGKSALDYAMEGYISKDDAPSVRAAVAHLQQKPAFGRFQDHKLESMAAGWLRAHVATFDSGEGIGGAGAPGSQLKLEGPGTPRVEVTMMRASTPTPKEAVDGDSAPSTPTGGASSAQRPSKRRRKNTKPGVQAQVSTARLEDLAGMDKVIARLKELVVFPFQFAELRQCLFKAESGATPDKYHVILHGPPGCGKTTLARAIVGEVQRHCPDVQFFSLAATEVVVSESGGSEDNVRALFRAAQDAKRAIVFIDEIDAIAPRRDSAGKDMMRRIVSQLVTCFDEINRADGTIMVLAATNRLSAIDPALLAGVRLSQQVAVGIPDRASRAAILDVLMRPYNVFAGLSLGELAENTPGYVGADLRSLVTTACINAGIRLHAPYLAHIAEEVGASTPPPAGDGEVPPPHVPSAATVDAFRARDDVCVVMDDFVRAQKQIKPSALREGFTTSPGVRWDDVGALEQAKADLERTILRKITQPEMLAAWGFSHKNTGVLLWGPPGNGKTLLARAIASFSNCNFISVKGPELMNKYVGESERSVRQVFERASTSAPCVIFFDELDALAPKRSQGENTSSDRVVNQLLTMLDGMEERGEVYVIGATNRPDIIDRAMLRSGRLGHTVYVPLPDEAGRASILRCVCAKRVARVKGGELRYDVAWDAVAAKAENFSGADLNKLVEEATSCAMEAALSEGARGGGVGSNVVREEHFDAALAKCHASVKPEDLKRYEKLRREWAD